MKKICLVLAIVFAMANISVFAEENPKVVVSQAEVNAGETVDITVSLEGNPGIISMLLRVDYDSSALALKEVKDAGVLGMAVHSDSVLKRPYILFWINGSAEENFTANGTVVTLTFEALKNAKTGIYPIKVSYDKEDEGIFNYNLDSVDFDMVNGQISVSGREDGEDAEEGSDVEEDVDAEEGAEAAGIENLSDEISVVIDGKYLEFPDQKPIIHSSRTLLPLRVIFEALGAKVSWDDATKTVTSKKGNTTISLTIDYDVMYVNDEAKYLDVAPRIRNERTMVPVRAIAESFGCEVGWDGRTKTVIITSK